jgi:hypothetical protein
MDTISKDKIHSSWRTNMSRKNRYYPPEFKREALEMLAAGEHNMASITAIWATWETTKLSSAANPAPLSQGILTC